MKNKTIGSLAFLIVTGTFCATSSTLRASEMDDRIVETAAKSYVFKTYLIDDSVKTSSVDGDVVLTGTVSHDFHSALAQDTVQSLPGVKSVSNLIEVKEEVPAKNTDAWLVRKVRTALIFHRNVNTITTEVTAKDGNVTLSGVASSIAQKELTSEYASDVEGVKDVDNNMSVTKDPVVEDRTVMEKIDDASITAQIKMSLLGHRSTSALKTEIKTKDGVVIINGMAKNAAERSLVTKLVLDTRGVVSVTNEMSVEGE